MQIEFGRELIGVDDQYKDVLQDIAGLPQLNFIADLLVERAAVKMGDMVESLDSNKIDDAKASRNYAMALQDTAQFLRTLKDAIKDHA